MERFLIQGVEIDPDVSFEVADVKAHGCFFRRNLIQFFFGHGIDPGCPIMNETRQVVHAVLLVVLQLVDRFDHVERNVAAI